MTRWPITALAFAVAVAAVGALAGCDRRLLPPADFETVRAEATAPPAEVVERGRLLIARYQCGQCHTVPGVPASRGTVAVTLDAYGQRAYIAGHIPNAPARLARFIEDPDAVIPGTLMPDLGVSAADAADIAAYLGQLR